MNLLPQDVVVLIKLKLLNNDAWTYNSIAYELMLSSSMVHSAIKRCTNAGLFVLQKRRPNNRALEEYLIHGVKYSFSPTLGTITRGIPTAFASPLLKEELSHNDSQPYVWMHPEGSQLGISVEPMYKSLPAATLKDPLLYKALSALDGIRIGEAREKKIAIEKLLSFIKSPS
ncbi:MAG: hypothetical protein JXR91_06670 [Deltaproteobacteria bacterium]|nr:hypothetical protein [Deltaproteobacteria bacterium]